MKRYLITPELRKTIKNNDHSMRQMNKLLGFEIKNICNKNKSIREDHLKKLNSFLDTDFQLKEIHFNYVKNLRMLTISPAPREIKENEDLAEFIGIMLGDGNIWKNRMKVSFDRRHNSYIDYVKKLTKKIFNINLRIKFEKNSNTCHLYYYNKNLIEQLIKFGLEKGDKIKNQVRIPEWIKENPGYIKRAIKGLIDTDGCVFFCKREKHTYVNFTNHNKRLLGDFKKTTKDLGYSFAKSNSTNARLYRKAEVVRFINNIKPFKSIGVVG